MEDHEAKQLVKSRNAAIVVVVSVVVAALIFLAPVVPFSMMVRNPGLQPTMQMTCSPRPGGIIHSTAPGVLYEGYESISHHFTGVGVMVYASCYTGY